jgi:hypothetical protein
MDTLFISPELLQDFEELSQVQNPVRYLEKEYYRLYKKTLESFG